MAYSVEQKKIFLNVVCAAIADGASLRSICDKRKLENFPHRDTINEWIKADQEFSDQYARAMELRQDALFEEIISISESTSNTEDSAVRVQRDRLRIDARKWALGKMNPKKYGDRAILEGDEDNPLKLSVSLKDMVAFKKD